MPRKLKLDIDFSSDTSLIAISCHKRDFWLAMQLNRSLKYDLRRMDDLSYYHPALKESLQYPLFYYADENTGLTWFLLGNYNQEGKLFPSYRAADYFLMANGTFTAEKVDRLLTQIKGIKGVLTAFEVDNKKLKDLKNFISDLELHMIGLLRTKQD